MQPTQEVRGKEEEEEEEGEKGENCKGKRGPSYGRHEEEHNSRPTNRTRIYALISFLSLLSHWSSKNLQQHTHTHTHPTPHMDA